MTYRLIPTNDPQSTLNLSKHAAGAVMAAIHAYEGNTSEEGHAILQAGFSHILPAEEGARFVGVTTGVGAEHAFEVSLDPQEFACALSAIRASNNHLGTDVMGPPGSPYIVDWKKIAPQFAWVAGAQTNAVDQTSPVKNALLSGPNGGRVLLVNQQNTGMQTSDPNQSIFSRIWAWLKDLWLHVKTWIGGTATPAQGTAGVGLLAAADDYGNHSVSWYLTCTDDGETVDLSEAQATLLSNASTREVVVPSIYHPGVPGTYVFEQTRKSYALHDGMGKGVSLSRAQIGAAVAPSGEGGIVSSVDFNGQQMLVRDRDWRTAIVLYEGADSPFASTVAPPVQAAMMVLDLAEDDESMAQIRAECEAGNVSMCKLAQAMLDAQDVYQRMTAEALVDGASGGDDESLATAQSYYAAAQEGDNEAAAICGHISALCAA